jgi:hypothetical protein
MDPNYKTVAENLTFQLIDIQESLTCTVNELDATLGSLIGIGVITREQLAERKNSWWEKKAAER